jgi:hypothetical protein
MLKANNCTATHEAILAAHTVAYATAALFKEHHKLKNGKQFIDPEPIVSHGIPIVHGIFGSSLDFVQLSSLVVGGKLNTQCQSPMTVTNVVEIRKFLTKDFPAKKDFRVKNTRVSVKNFMEPILEYLKRYAAVIEVYSCIYDNKLTYTNVYGLIIVTKSVIGGGNLIWEVSIDDADLIAPLSTRGMFCRN